MAKKKNSSEYTIQNDISDNPGEALLSFEEKKARIEKMLQERLNATSTTHANRNKKPKNFFTAGLDEIREEVKRVFGIGENGNFDANIKLIKRTPNERFKDSWYDFLNKMHPDADPTELFIPLNKDPDKLAWYERVAIAFNNWVKMSGNGKDEKDWSTSPKIFAKKISLLIAGIALDLCVMVGRVIWGGIIKGAAKSILGVGAIVLGTLGLLAAPLSFRKNFATCGLKAIGRGILSLTAGATRLAVGVAVLSALAFAAASGAGLPLAGAISAGASAVYTAVIAPIVATIGVGGIAGVAAGIVAGSFAYGTQRIMSLANEEYKKEKEARANAESPLPQNNNTQASKKHAHPEIPNEIKERNDKVLEEMMGVHANRPSGDNQAHKVKSGATFFGKKTSQTTSSHQSDPDPRERSDSVFSRGKKSRK